MADTRTAGSAGQGCPAGVGEEIQCLNRTSRSANRFGDEIPVYSLLREYAGVLEIHRLDQEGQVAIMDWPTLRKAVVRPTASAGIGPRISRVVALPVRVTLWRIPDHLWIRTHQVIASPSFQLLAFGSIQNFKVFPLIGNPHLFLLS